MRRHIKGVIFDLDGVICSTDKYHFEAWKKLADRLLLVFDETVNDGLRGVSRMESLALILEFNGKSSCFTEQDRRSLAAEKNETYKALLGGLTPSDVGEGVLETLNRLRSSKIKLAIGSSSKNARFILERIGLKDFFDIVSDGNNISRSKPDPEVFLKAAEGLKLSPSECIVVEDAAAGIAAAVSGGFESIAVGAAVHCIQADFSIKKFDEIIKYI